MDRDRRRPRGKLGEREHAHAPLDHGRPALLRDEQELVPARVGRAMNLSPDTLVALAAPVLAIAAKWVSDKRFQRRHDASVEDLTKRVHGIDAELSGLRDDSYVLISGRLTAAVERINTLQTSVNKLALAVADVGNGKLAAVMAELKQVRTDLTRLEGRLPNSS